MSAISFTIPGLIKKVLDKLPTSTAELAKANVCTEQRLSVLDDISSHMGASGSYFKVVTLSGKGTWQRPADMLGNTVYVTGCGAGGRGATKETGTSMAGASAGACAIMVPVTIGATANYSVAGAQPLGAADGAVAPSTQFGPLTLKGGRAAVHKRATAVNPGGGNDVLDVSFLFEGGNPPLEVISQPPTVGVVWTGGHGGHSVQTGTAASGLPPFQNTSITGAGRVSTNLSADSLLGVSRQGGVRWGSGGVARRSHQPENPTAAASGPGLLRIYYPTAS